MAQDDGVDFRLRFPRLDFDGFMRLGLNHRPPAETVKKIDGKAAVWSEFEFPRRNISLPA